MVSRDGARLFELGLGPAALAFVSASKPEDHSKINEVLARAPGRAFLAAWLEARGQGAAADAARRFVAAADALATRTDAVAAE